ncbi:MAG TPA: hypothetical protein VGJ37_09790 [Pyrinomonadaceae bacterium]|jgi:hypothetical protein
MNSDPHENRHRRLAIAIASRCLAAIIAFSFLATLLPAGTAAAKSIMACCKGQAAGHCHASIKTKKSASISAPCHPDCCSSIAAAQQQKRERAIAPPVAKLVVPFVVLSQTTTVTPLLSSPDEWNQTSPRGPPASFLQ